ncbi:MAG: TonB-dependent receptor [Bacteroidales bacterium]
MKKFLIINLLLLFSIQIVIAQNRTIKGTVTSKSDNISLPGVAVIIKGTSIGVNTDLDGKYSIKVPMDKNILVFSFIGTKTQEIPIDNKSIINVQLSNQILGLDEVVVIGYGVENRRDITGAISSVDNKKFDKTPLQNIEKAIQGKAAGVQVTGDSGAPGGNVTIRIRGVGSINGSNSPLCIVDGIQMSFNDINPNDIASIDILKDAASASIYGAQAANGVVIVTTKQGQVGKPKFQFQTSQGFSQVIRKLDVLNSKEFMELSLVAMKNYADIYGRGSSSYESKYENVIQEYEQYGLTKNDDGSLNYDNVSTYDWQDAIFRKGYMQDYMLSASGGNDNIKYFVSGSYNNTKGSVINSSYERYTLRSNLNAKISKRLQLNTQLSLGRSNTSNVSSGSSYSNPYRTAMLMVPFNTPYNSDGSFNMDKYYGNYDHNIIMDAELNKGTEEKNRVTARLNFDYKILNNLTFESNYSIYYYLSNYDKYYDPRTSTGKTYNGRVSSEANQSQNLQTEQILKYSKKINNHNFDAMIGFSYQDTQYKDLYASANGVPSYHFTYLSSTAVPDEVSGSASEWKMASVFSRLKYNYKGKYMVNATLRRDGSSRFGENNKWGLFPSVSVAWRISDENFMKDFTFIDDLKIRSSFGVTGNTAGISYYGWQKLFSAGGAYGGQPTIHASSIGNSDLSWEKNESFNIGLAYSFLESRIRGGIDFYRSIRNNLLYTRPLPYTTGYSGMTENVGKIENKGIEFTLNTINIKTTDFEWNSSFNISHNTNKVKELIDGVETIGYSLKVGEPVNTYCTYEWAGVNPADGRPMYYDKNGNITYEPKVEDRKWIGSLDPVVLGGFGNDFRYKNISLSIFFQFQQGGQTYSSDFKRLARSGNSIDRNQYQNQYDDYWKEPGDITEVPMPSKSNHYYHHNPVTSPYSTSTRSYLSTDYLRLKNITLSYDFSKKLCNKMSLDGIQIYAQATNIWTYTKFQGWDPELTGDDTGVYPQGKNITAGLKISF